MSYIFSHIDVSSTEHGFLSTVGQELVFDAATEYVARINNDLETALRVFVDGNTESFKQKYKLPGGGYLSESDDNGNYGNVKTSGGWEVAYPLKDFGRDIEVTDVALGYMTGQELSNHINTVITQNVATVRREILRRIFKNTTDTFDDVHHGSLTIQPLANGDSVLYAPVLGSDSEETEDHYLEAGYLATAISDSNDPFSTIANELEHHFGTPTGGSNIVVFINSAQTAKTRDLASFTSVADMGVDYGDDTSLAQAVPSELIAMGSARVLGRHEEAGCWIVQWPYIPANYMVGIHLDAPAPLRMRVDPASTGLGQGLQLVAQSEQFPFTRSTWRNRFGIGASNRLNGVVMELANGGGYTIPSAYS